MMNIDDLKWENETLKIDLRQSQNDLERVKTKLKKENDYNKQLFQEFKNAEYNENNYLNLLAILEKMIRSIDRSIK